MVSFFAAVACIVCGIVLLCAGICCGIAYSTSDKDKEQAQREREEYKERTRVAEMKERELMAKVEKERKEYQAKALVTEKENRELMAENEKLREDLNQSNQTLLKERKESKIRTWAAEEEEGKLRAKNEELQDEVNAMLAEKGAFLKEFGPVIAFMERTKADQAREQQREADARSREQQMHGTTNVQRMYT